MSIIRQNMPTQPDERMPFEKLAYAVHDGMKKADMKGHVLAGTEDFRALLPKLDLNREGDEALIFIRPYIHAMSIYMRVVNGKVKCFIGDSQGWHWKYYPTRNLIAAINEQFGSQAEIILPNTSLQSKEIQRGCEVVSASCLKHCAKKGKQFFQEAEKIEADKKNKKLLEIIEKSGLILQSKITLLEKSKLPPSLLEALRKELQKGDSEEFWSQERTTINQYFLDKEYESYEEIAKKITAIDEKTWQELFDWQHLPIEYYTPEVESSPLYDIKIVKSEEKYSLEIQFEKGKIGLAQLKYGNCLTFSDARYPKEVEISKLQTIFDGLTTNVSIDETNNKIIVKADNKAYLETILNQLSSLEHRVKLYQRGMRQHLGLAQFVFEAREAVKIRDRKQSLTGGLFLGEVNAALQYFLEAYGVTKVVVLQETLGINNTKLPENVKDLLEAGNNKVVFSSDVIGVAHQVAVIVDKVKKKITVIDSEGKNQGQKEIEEAFKKHKYFNEYSFSYPTPIVKQVKEEWSCGVDVVLNILDELGEIPDRKNVDMEEWLRKILRASEIVERTRLEKQNKIISRDIIIEFLNKNIEKISDVDNRKLISTLMNFLNSYVKNSSASTLTELTETTQYKAEKFNSSEEDVLVFIYALTELNLTTSEIEKHVLDYFSFKNNQEANKDFIEFSHKKVNTTLSNDVSNLIEADILDEIKSVKSFSEKKSKLYEFFQKNIYHTDNFSEQRENLTKWIQTEGNKPDVSVESIYKWIDYLYVTKLNQIISHLTEIEKSFRKEAKSKKESSGDRLKREIDTRVNKIEELLGKVDIEKYQEALSFLRQINKKISKVSPEGWAELIKTIGPNKELLNKILTDYESSNFSNFFISALKTLTDSGEEQKAIDLATNKFVEKILIEKGYFGILEAGLLLPKKHQSQFFNNHIDLLKNETNLSINSTDLNDIVGFFSTMIKGLDPEQCIQFLQALPGNMNLELFPAVKKHIGDEKTLIEILSTLPENERASIAKQFTSILTGDKLAELINTLPPNDRYSFTSDFLKTITNPAFFPTFEHFPDLLSLLTLEERKIALAEWDRFITDGFVLAKIIKQLPLQMAIDCINKYEKRILDGTQLYKVAKSLSEEDIRFSFIKNNIHLIQNATELSYIVELISDKDKISFIKDHDKLIKNGADLAQVALSLPTNKFSDFINEHLHIIVKGTDLVAIVRVIPSDNRVAFILDRISLIQNNQELINVLNKCSLDEGIQIVNLIKDKINPENSTVLVEIMRYLHQDELFDFALKHANVSKISELPSILALLPKEMRLSFHNHCCPKISSRNYINSVEVGNIIRMLPHKDQIPFIEGLINAGILHKLGERGRFQKLDIQLALLHKSPEVLPENEVEEILKKLDKVGAEVYQKVSQHRLYPSRKDSSDETSSDEEDLKHSPNKHRNVGE